METIKSEHHPLGMSKWPHWAACPEWTEELAPTSPAAEAGTLSHKEFAKCIEAYNNDQPIESQDNIALRSAMIVIADAKQANVKHIDSERTVNISGNWIDEKHASYKPLAGIYGTCDAFFWNRQPEGDVLEVYDYKSGGNSGIDYTAQAAGYALAIVSHMVEYSGFEISMLFDGTKVMVRTHIIYGADNTVDVKVMSLKDVLRYAEMSVLRHYDNLNSLPHELTVCESCKYCANRKVCTALNEHIDELGDMALCERRPSVFFMDEADQYAILSSIKSVIEKRLEELKAQAVQNGGKLTGKSAEYVLKTNQRGSLIAIDIPKLYLEVLSRGLIISQDDIMRNCTISKEKFIDLCRNEAKAHGVKIKELEDMYISNGVYGRPASKMVKVNKQLEAK